MYSDFDEENQDELYSEKVCLFVFISLCLRIRNPRSQKILMNLIDNILKPYFPCTNSYEHFQTPYKNFNFTVMCCSTRLLKSTGGSHDEK